MASNAVWGFVGVVVGAVLSFFFTVIGSVLVRRWELRFTATAEAFRLHLPEARLATYSRDADALLPSDRLIRSCMLIGDAEAELAVKLGETGARWRYFRELAHDTELGGYERATYEREAQEAAHEYNVVADELEARLTARFVSRNWLARRLLG